MHDHRQVSSPGWFAHGPKWLTSPTSKAEFTSVDTATPRSVPSHTRVSVTGRTLDETCSRILEDISGPRLWTTGRLREPFAA